MFMMFDFDLGAGVGIEPTVSATLRLFADEATYALALLRDRPWGVLPSLLSGALFEKFVDSGRYFAG